MAGARNQRGFTLLEILVAFVVLATSVAILYRTFSAGLNSVQALSGYNEAIALAEAKLGTLGLEQPVKEGEDSGTSEDGRFKWTIAIKPYTPPATQADPGGIVTAHELLRATVTVTWDEVGQQKRSIELATVRMVGKNAI